MKKGTSTRKIALLALAIAVVIVICVIILKQQTNRARPHFNTQVSSQPVAATQA